MVIRCLQNWG